LLLLNVTLRTYQPLLSKGAEIFYDVRILKLVRSLKYSTTTTTKQKQRKQQKQQQQKQKQNNNNHKGSTGTRNP
jgi:hypothetical protein